MGEVEISTQDISSKKYSGDETLHRGLLRASTGIDALQPHSDVVILTRVFAWFVLEIMESRGAKFHLRQLGNE
jgi:hypothetical protein